jgi:hypothetical protein
MKNANPGPSINIKGRSESAAVNKENMGEKTKTVQRFHKSLEKNTPITQHLNKGKEKNKAG